MNEVIKHDKIFKKADDKLRPEIGREEGIKRTVINMLKQNLDIRLIEQCTGLPTDKIKMLKDFI